MAVWTDAGASLSLSHRHICHLLLDNVSDTDLIVPTLINNAAIFPLWAADFLFVRLLLRPCRPLTVCCWCCVHRLQNCLLPLRNPDLCCGHACWLSFCALALSGVRPPGDILQITIFSGSLRGVFFPAWCLVCTGQGSCRAVWVRWWRYGNAAAWLAYSSFLLHEVFQPCIVAAYLYRAQPTARGQSSQSGW